MADSFERNSQRILENERNYASNVFLNRAFALCSNNKETFENCFVKQVKGWTLFKEALDEQLGKDTGKYRAYKKMEDKQAWLNQRDHRYL